MSSLSHTVPNFFIAGASKTGTTSLYHWLAAHPQVYMSPNKEPSYFSTETRPENFAPEYQAMVRQQMEDVKRFVNEGPEPKLPRKEISGVVVEWQDYLRLFSGATNETAIGEGSVCYLWSRTAAQGIAERVPHARILLILRDPAERAFSQYLHYVSLGHISRSFRQHVMASMNPGDKFNPFNPFLQIGLYAEHLQRYFAVFPRKQIRVWLYEDTLAQPEVFHRQVMEFLQIDTSFVPDVSKRYLEVEVPKLLGITQAMRRNGLWGRLRGLTPKPLRPMLRKAAYRRRRTVHLAQEDRRFLVDYYKDDIRRLQQLLDRDLSAWLM